jgi:REP element-mobilizing transposase RayT
MNTRSYSQPELVPTVKNVEHPFKSGQYVAVHSRARRLSGIDYCSPNCLCFVTFKLQGEGPTLTEHIGATAWQAFLDQWAREQFTMHTACMMPDHFHLLLAPIGNGKSVNDIVRGIKLAITHKVKQEHNTWLRWQPSFYDHVLGRADNLEDEFESVRFYIRNNPIRAGLAASIKEYPYML